MFCKLQERTKRTFFSCEYSDHGVSRNEFINPTSIIEKEAISLDRCRAGLSSRGFLLVGLRGVGKTVLLTRIANDTEARGFAVVTVEAPEKRSLAA